MCMCSNVVEKCVSHSSRVERAAIIEEVCLMNDGFVHASCMLYGRDLQHTHTVILQPFVRDYPGGPVPEETLYVKHCGSVLSFWIF